LFEELTATCLYPFRVRKAIDRFEKFSTAACSSSVPGYPGLSRGSGRWGERNRVPTRTHWLHGSIAVGRSDARRNRGGRGTRSRSSEQHDRTLDFAAADALRRRRLRPT